MMKTFTPSFLRHRPDGIPCLPYIVVIPLEPTGMYWYSITVVVEHDISGILLVDPYVNWENKKENRHENFNSLHKFGVWYFRYSSICQRS
jgi:hypothetical protein